MTDTVDTGTPAAPDAAAAAAAAAASSSSAWTTGLDAETLGHIQNRGWASKPANEVAVEAIKAHREAEKFIGAPANQIVRLPTDPADPAWKGVWQRLGAPGDAKEYDFSAVKNGDGSDLDPALADHLRTVAAEANLPKDAAARVAAGVAKYLGDASTKTLGDKTAALIAEKADLAKNWGVNAEANMFVAKQTAMKLGVTPEQVAALESVVGYSKVMEMFRSIGQKTGEDNFVNGGISNPNIMTREAATARRAELMKDGLWTKRYLEGDTEAVRQMTGLLTIMHGDDTDASRRA